MGVLQKAKNRKLTANNLKKMHLYQVKEIMKLIQPPKHKEDLALETEIKMKIQI